MKRGLVGPHAVELIGNGAATPPEIRADSVANLLKLPPDMHPERRRVSLSTQGTSTSMRAAA
jgi:hypothetical protein